MKVFAIDIGGSSVKYALLEVERGKAAILTAYKPEQLPSNLFSDLRGTVVAATEYALQNEDISTVAISTTGNVDQNGTVRRAGHFQGYENVSWPDILRSEFPRLSRVTTVNDGKAATWAEFSATKGISKAFAHVVVGTGIGGGIVINGQLFYGNEGSAGSFGHIKVCVDTKIRCSCTRIGCVETVASAPAIIREYKRANQDRNVSEQLGLEEIAMRAEAGDKSAVRAFAEAGRWLGVALSDVMNIVNPEIVTIGGGVVLAAQSILGPNGRNVFIEETATSAKSLALRRVAAATEIRGATYGNDSGLIGAAILACEA